MQEDRRVSVRPCLGSSLCIAGWPELLLATYAGVDEHKCRRGSRDMCAATGSRRADTMMVAVKDSGTLAWALLKAFVQILGCGWFCGKLYHFT